MKSSVVTAEECLPLFPPLFWLLLPEAGPAEYPERCFLTCGLLKRKTEERQRLLCWAWTGRRRGRCWQQSVRVKRACCITGIVFHNVRKQIQVASQTHNSLISCELSDVSEVVELFTILQAFESRDDYVVFTHCSKEHKCILKPRSS